MAPVPVAAATERTATERVTMLRGGDGNCGGVATPVAAREHAAMARARRRRRVRRRLRAGDDGAGGDGARGAGGDGVGGEANGGGGDY